jgi:hypothetical protein
MKFRQVRAFSVFLLLSVTGGVLFSQASDHSDAPTAGAITRQDANILDLHAFVVGPNLVLSLSTNAAIPTTATDYVFPTDVTYDIKIDVDSAVDTSTDPLGDGGTVWDPSSIREDITFRIRFRDNGSAKVQRIAGKRVQRDPQIVNLFTGLRDDPFIRLPREGRNVAVIVLEVPLSSILREQSTILMWATSRVEDFKGKQQEITGRSLRSMFPEQNFLNYLHPKDHGPRPDVVIYDTSNPAAFPNGRALEDDVVDLACSLSGECRVFNQEGASSPSTNDVPFLNAFPYLAPPH